MPIFRGRRGGFRGFDLVVHAKAFAFDNHGLSVVQQSIEDCGGEGRVVVEDLGPGFEGLIGGQDCGAAFIALADDLEEPIDSGSLSVPTRRSVQWEEAEKWKNRKRMRKKGSSWKSWKKIQRKNKEFQTDSFPPLSFRF